MHEDLLDLWLATRLMARVGGRTVDLDGVPPGALAATVRPLRLPLCLVTGWNPRATGRARGANRTANRRLRSSLDARHPCWAPAVGRAPDGAWAEPGFLVGGLSRAEAANLAAEWDQLGVFVVTADDVAVIAADGSQPCARPRHRAVAPSQTRATGTGGFRR